MAKDLPYFKFFCSEWNDGDVTLEDYEIQGLYINICSYFWSNECYLSIDKLKKRFKHNTSDIDYLFKNDLLHNENGYLAIHFLDEQLEERKATSKRNSKAGLKSAELRKNKKATPVEIPLNVEPTIKIREEEIREEESEGKFTPIKFLVWFNERRAKLLDKPSNINYLSQESKAHLEILTSRYTGDDFTKALKNICNDKWANETNNIMPKHFLNPEQFSKYLDMKTIPNLSKTQKTMKGWAIC